MVVMTFDLSAGVFRIVESVRIDVLVGVYDVCDFDAAICRFLQSWQHPAQN